ncbi:MAG: protoporphyrinogen oxidase [Pirellulales bacterium]
MRRAAALLQDVSPTLTTELRGIPYAGSGVVSLGFRLDRFARPPQGFGMVVPAREGRDVLAVSYASAKFPGRAPKGSILLRVFVGGALRPELNRLDDAALTELALREVRRIYGIQGEPLTTLVARWNGAMPQYHLGHLERIARIDAAVAALPGLALAGAAYRGVGIPQCIRDGRRAAETVLG